MTAPASATRWTNEALDRLRRVADPVTDPLSRQVLEAGGPGALGRLTRQLDDWEAPLPDDLTPAMRAYFDTPLTYPAWVDQSRIAHADGFRGAGSTPTRKNVTWYPKRRPSAAATLPV